MAQIVVASSMIKKAFDTGTTADASAFRIKRTDANRLKTRKTRKTRMIRITVNALPPEVKIPITDSNTTRVSSQLALSSQNSQNQCAPIFRANSTQKKEMKNKSITINCFSLKEPSGIGFSCASTMLHRKLQMMAMMTRN